MRLLEVLFIAINSLKANKLRAGLTMLGLSIGVFAVMLLVSIGTGAQRYVLKQFEGISANMLTVTPGKLDSESGMGAMGSLASTKKKLTLADVEALERRGFRFAALSGISFGTVTLKYEDKTNNVTMIGSNEMLPEIMAVEASRGRFFNREESASGRRVVFLGATTAANLFGSEDPLGKWIKINQAIHQVIGVGKPSGQVLGFDFDEIAYIPIHSAIRIFNEERLWEIDVKARSRNEMAEAAAEVREILIQRRGEEDFTITTQESIQDTMTSVMDMLTYVLMGIAGVSILVGGVGIMNIMLVSVRERTREIGIRRAIGAKRTDILKQFIAEAILLSLLGGMVGLGGAMIITFGVSVILPSFNMRPPEWVYLPSIGMSLGVGILFGVWPALKAARTLTIEALRFE